MEAIALLSGVKLLIDFFEGNWTGVATGILLPPPINEVSSLGGSVYYLFDIDGNRIGTKDISGIRQISGSKISLSNKTRVMLGFEKAKKNISFQKDKNENIGFNKK